MGGYLAAAFLLLIMGLGGAIWAINRRNSQCVVNSDSSCSADAAVLSGLAQLEHLDGPEPVEALEQNRLPHASTYDITTAPPGDLNTTERPPTVS
jgi:hypothetical protein